ncbi:MAG: vacuolar family H+-ATPase subunit H [Eubacterium sp.]
MQSKIEQIITEIEEYVDSCRFQPLSTTKIIVNKDEIDELLSELRLKTPDEIKKYQKIIANKEAILNDAKERSEAMIAEATAHITELVSEHEIMQQAYKQANQVIAEAEAQAKEILNNATSDANNIREGAMKYTDDILSNVQNVITNGLSNIEANHNELVNMLNSSLDVVVKNRSELSGADDDTKSNDTYEDYTVDLDD